MARCPAEPAAESRTRAVDVCSMLGRKMEWKGLSRRGRIKGMHVSLQGRRRRPCCLSVLSGLALPCVNETENQDWQDGAWPAALWLLQAKALGPSPGVTAPWRGLSHKAGAPKRGKHRGTAHELRARRPAGAGNGDPAAAQLGFANTMAVNFNKGAPEVRGGQEPSPSPKGVPMARRKMQYQKGLKLTPTSL